MVGMLSVFTTLASDRRLHFGGECKNRTRIQHIYNPVDVMTTNIQYDCSYTYAGADGVDRKKRNRKVVDESNLQDRLLNAG